MKSPLVQEMDAVDDAEKACYSELQVMYSNAGFYIGTTFTDPETGLIEPGSRDSQYFESKIAAEQALLNKTWKQRDNP